MILLNLCKNSLQDELDGFFKATRELAVASRVAWKSAFSQARYKLHSSAFEELNDLVIERFYRTRRARRWHGLRLLAGDGSTARLPDTDEVLEHFGGMIAATGRAHALARVVSVFDPLNRLTVAAKIAPYAAGERELLAELLPRFGKQDLLLLDRGYPAFWLFALLVQKRIGFCVRASVSYSPEVTAFLASGKRDAVITFRAGAHARRQCREWGASSQPLELRVVRVELPGGGVEVLITSLTDRRRFRHREFQGLYQLRWGVEESFKALKCRVEMENWTGKYAEAVYQDFHAKIVTTNLTAVFAAEAQVAVERRTRKRVLSYRVNFAHALSKMKDTVLLLLTRQRLDHYVGALLRLYADTIEPIRPNRSYPRRPGPKLQGFFPCYKPAH